jgi:hypothetical protein
MKTKFLVFVSMVTALATVLGATAYAQTVTSTPRPTTTTTPSPSPTGTTPGGAPQTGFGTLAN